MTNIFKVALLQLNRTNNEQDAISKGIEYCKKAKEMGADIAVFPETWNNGYEMLFEGYLTKDMNISQEKLSAWKNRAIDENSNYINTFKVLAKELDMAIAITFFEKNNSLPKNSLLIIDRFGNTVLKYSKVHTVDCKMEAFMEPGKEFKVCDLNYKNGTIELGAMICYDRDFPESARILMLKGAEIILVPNACRMTKIRLEQLKVRAYENMTGIVTVNYANYGGHSSAFSPIVRDINMNDVDSELLIMDDIEQIKVVDFNMDEIRDYRNREPLGDAYRKPYAYKDLIQKTVKEPFIRDNSRRNYFE